MKTVYNLEYSHTDKIGRAKKMAHVGVFETIKDLEVAKNKLLEENSNIVFEVYTIEHIFSEP